MSVNFIGLLYRTTRLVMSTNAIQKRQPIQYRMDAYTVGVTILRVAGVFTSHSPEDSTVAGTLSVCLYSGSPVCDVNTTSSLRVGDVTVLSCRTHRG